MPLRITVIVNIYDDTSSGIKLYIFVIINIYTSIPLMCRALTICYLSNANPITPL